MSLFDSLNSIKLLQDLLKNPDDSESDDDQPSSSTGCYRVGPGNIGAAKTSTIKKSNEINKLAMKLEETTSKQPGSVEEWMAAEQQAADEQLESRERPNYTIVYKQAVRTEDMFLQVGCKTPGTASCEDMIVEIDLPNEEATIEAMQLDVTRNTIDVRTPCYRLKMPLSQPVDPDLGKAEYDAERRVLKLTLRMRRELDFVNF